MKKTYTVKEVAKLLGFSTNTVYKYLDEGKIKATRLGKEGRFRILPGEIERLIPQNNSSEQISENPTLAVQATSLKSVEPVNNHIFIQSEDKSVFSLFTWFMALTSVLFTLTNTVFPLNVIFSISSWSSYLLIMAKIIMFVSGISLIFLDIFKSDKNQASKRVLLFLLGFSYFISSLIFIFSGDVVSSLIYFSISIILFTNSFKDINSFINFYSLISLISFLFAILVFVSPNSIAISSLKFIVIHNKYLISMICFFVSAVITYIHLYLPHKNHKLISLTGIILSMVSFVFLTLSFSEGLWEQAIFSMNIGVFSLIFPFWHSLNADYRLPKKTAIASFIWVFSLILFGIILVIFLQKNFEESILNDMDYKINRTSHLVDSYMIDAVNKAKAISQLEGIEKSLSSLNSRDLDEILRSSYLVSDSTFKRYMILDENGELTASYPIIDQFKISNFFNKDYFDTPTDKSRIFIANLDNEIIVSSPILDGDSNLIGLFVGSISLETLEKRINMAEANPNISYYLVDENKRFLLHQNSALLGSIWKNRQIDSMEKKGGIGYRDYDENGELSFFSYKGVNSTKWTVLIKQPLLTASKRSNSISYVVLVIVTISGFGSVVAIQIIRNRK